MMLKENKTFNSMIDREKLCECGLKYIKHFYYESGSTTWYWAWIQENECEGFREKSKGENII